MVQRASQAPEFGSSTARVQLQGTQVGNARMDQSLAQAVPSGLDTALAALVPSLSKVADTAMQTSMEEAYLQGVSAAATKQTEEQLELNPITADWQRAGFRDTMGKLAHAEQESQLISDMPKLRQLSPAEFQDELGRRRADLLPQLEGMSRRQRESSLQQFAASEARSIKQHGVEHQKWIIETDIAGIQAQAKSKRLALDAARASGDIGTYQAALAEWQITLVDLASNERIPADAKSKVVREIADFALASDHLPVYDLVTAGNWGDSENPVFKYLTTEDSVALSQSARQAEQRTEAVRSIAWQDQDAALSANIDSGSLPDVAQYQAHLLDGVNKKFISGDAYRTRLQALYKKKLENDQSSGMAAAAAAGDIGALFRMGADDEKGVKAWEVTQRDKPLQAVVQGLINMGQKGLKYGYKRAAELSAGAWSELQFSPEKMLPENLQLLHGTISQLDTLEQNGQRAAMVGYLGGFDADTRSFIEQYRIQRKAGGSHTVAASKASEALQAHAGKTPQQRASMAAANTDWESFKDNQTRLFNAPGNAWAIVKDMMPWGSNDNRQMRELGVNTDLFEKESASRAALYPVWTAVLEEAEKEVIRHPGNAGEAAMRIAMAEVASKRILPTSQTPILIPAGVDVKKVYGANSTHTLADIGKAIDRISKPQDGFRRVYEQDKFGNLTYSDWDKKTGANTGTKATVPASAIRQSLLELDKEAAGRADKAYGAGKTVTANGLKLTFNGDNTAGVSNELALQHREALVRFEGIRDTAYPDLSGKGTTVGVGIHSSSTFYPKGIKPGDKVSPEVLNSTFMGASDAALKQGKSMAVQLGVANNAGYLFASQLAYQAGNWLSPKHPDKAMQSLVQAITKRDKEAAIKAFESTTAAKYGEGRREWYKSQIRKMLG